MSKSVLIVDDSPYMREMIKEIMSKAGHDVVGEAGTGEAAIDQSLELSPDVITLDNILPDMIGTDILKVIKDQGLDSKVIMVSAVGQQSVIDEGLALGATDYIVKPFSADQLTDLVDKI